MAEVSLVNVLFTVIGFLLGLGGMSIWVMKRVDVLAVKMKAAEKDIERLDEKDHDLEAQIKSAVALHTESVKLLTNIVNQNNLLIQKIIATNGD